MDSHEHTAETTESTQALPEHDHSILDYFPPMHVAHVLIGVGITIAIIVPFLILKYRHKIKEHKTITSRDLEAEQAKSSFILNAIVDGVMVVDTEGVIRLFNPAASTITGWNAEEAVGLDYRGVIQLVDIKGDPYDPAKHPFALANSELSTVRDRKAILKTRSNKTLSLDITVSPFVDANNTFRGLVGIFRDISEQLEEESQRADFISTASHEMRTPVAAIEGYLALAMNDRVSKIDDKARTYLQKAHESTQHLGVLFQDLLTSSKVEDGRLMNHPQVIEMSEFLAKLVEEFKFTAQAKSLNLEYILGAPDSVISASSSVVKPLYYSYIDPDRIHEVMTNLFDNAIKYTERGKIVIGLTGDNEVVQIRVADTGSGIASEDVPHLFQKFYRVDNSITRTVGGTGLGLFICRKIIELYHGRIWVESEPGQGSTFYINLPRLSNDKVAQLQQQGTTPISQIMPNEPQTSPQKNRDTIPTIST